MLQGQLQEASAKCHDCARAYLAMQRPVDAAEALLERVLVDVRRPEADATALQEILFEAETLLSDSGAHRPLLWMARGCLAHLAEDPEQAIESFGMAVDAAAESGQRQWLWRAQEQSAQVQLEQGDAVAAAEARRVALSTLEEIASELPRDLREVYWNDPRRRALKKTPRTAVLADGHDRSPTDVHAPTQFGITRQERFSRVLEINREIAGEYDLDRLLEKVTDHAIALVAAERGFVLLRSASGRQTLSVHAARDQRGDEPHARFSQSIAERVVDTGKPFVAMNAPHDERVSDYVSVHSLMLRSVACVPIFSRSQVIGALYLETRLRPGSMFDEELPTLAALADQVAIAIETARLVSENLQRARELETANEQLEVARKRLEEALGRRTEQLPTHQAQSAERTGSSARTLWLSWNSLERARRCAGSTRSSTG